MEDARILAAPLGAGLLALLGHLPLGVQVLRRRIVFIDLAIAQFAAFGVLIVGDDADRATALAAGMGFALAAALLAAWLESRWPRQREALVGLLYVGGSAAAMLWASRDPHGGQALARILAGDILWAGWQDLAPLALATAPITALAWRRPRLLDDSRVFYPCFAVLVSLSVPLLGLYLVFATLIVPALATRAARSPAVGLAVGVSGLAAGLAISLLTDLPSGPAVMLALIASALLARLMARARRPALHWGGDEQHDTHLP